MLLACAAGRDYNNKMNINQVHALQSHFSLVYGTVKVRFNACFISAPCFMLLSTENLKFSLYLFVHFACFSSYVSYIEFYYLLDCTIGLIWFLHLFHTFSVARSLREFATHQ